MPYRKIAFLLLVVVVLIAGTSTRVLADDLVRRDKMLHLLNQTRRNHDLPTFRLNASLSHDAWRHSKAMAERGYLFHTADLYGVVRSYQPTMWGENVGEAGWLKLVRTLWMRSAPHRQNILKPGFRRIGIGVVKARGMLWVTTIFYGG
jgi:uncharacterized protein YkwD